MISHYFLSPPVPVCIRRFTWSTVPVFFLRHMDCFLSALERKVWVKRYLFHEFKAIMSFLHESWIYLLLPVYNTHSYIAVSSNPTYITAAERWWDQSGLVHSPRVIYSLINNSLVISFNLAHIISRFIVKCSATHVVFVLLLLRMCTRLSLWQ
jgi:hypothetical protein